jgi:hypothetical protein
MQKRLTRAHKAIGSFLDSAFEYTSPDFNGGGELSFDQLLSMYSAHILNGGNDIEARAKLIKSGIRNFELIAESHPELTTIIKDALHNIGTAVLLATSDKIHREIESEALRFGGLSEKNSAKKSTIERAKLIATENWATDDSKEIRTSAMADKVWNQLIDEGLSEQLPDNVERVKVWIRGVAPDYAKAKGRSKKRST